MRERVRGILMLYFYPVENNASTITEHVFSIGRHSGFETWNVNTVRFPEGLDRLDFDVIVLHYSLFGIWPYGLGPKFLRLLEQSGRSYKIAFMQDEHRYCGRRFEFLNTHGVDCLYTLLHPDYHDLVYRRHTTVPKLVYTIPGFVSDELVELGRRHAKPDAERAIDVGYRARRLQYYMGRGSQEKHEIAEEFARRAAPLGLRLDLETDEDKRIYGEAWYEFLGNCRGNIGVEAGVSLFDLEDKALAGYEALMRERPDIGFEEMYERVLKPWDGNIRYRTMSPRHFESAALRACQILYEGRYSDVLEPGRHYIPLKKDFSNFDEVMRQFLDPGERREITDNAYADLIASGRHTYQGFVRGFDAELAAEGLEPGVDAAQKDRVSELIGPASAKQEEKRERA